MLHTEEDRSYGDMRPYVAAGLFEERLKSGLKQLQAFLPTRTAMAFFNTHAVCDEKLIPAGLQARARACASGDTHGCFGCDDDSSKSCAAFEDWQRVGYNATLLSAYGARSLAQRESAVLKGDDALSHVHLVDGHGITLHKCDMTEDGRHYTSVEAIEARAALDSIGNPVTITLSDREQIQ